MQFWTCSIVATSLLAGLALYRAPQAETPVRETASPLLAPGFSPACDNTKDLGAGMRRLEATDLVRLDDVRVVVSALHELPSPTLAPTGWCGTCSAWGVTFAVNDDFFWGEYDSEEAADAALEIEANRIAAFDAWIEAVTAFWDCPGCVEAPGCSKYLQWFGGKFGYSVLFDATLNAWRIGIICMEPGTVYPCCSACVY